jgi:hypothetical protein
MQPPSMLMIEEVKEKVGELLRELKLMQNKAAI